MGRLLLLSLVLSLILYFFWKRDTSKKNSNIYRNLLVLLVFLTIIFLIVTQGKFLLPKLFQLIKIGLPFLTKFIA